MACGLGPTRPKALNGADQRAVADSVVPASDQEVQESLGSPSRRYTRPRQSRVDVNGPGLVSGRGRGGRSVDQSKDC